METSVSCEMICKSLAKDFFYFDTLKVSQDSTEQKIFPTRAKNRKAISVVLTTLIILVASVVLGTGVVLYGTSLFQTGAQQQSISSQGIKMWVNATNSNNVAWGAAAIRNNGDVLVSVSSIQIRDASIPYSSWYVDTNSSHTSANFQAQFISTGTVGATFLMRSNTVNGFGGGSTGNVCPASSNPILINEQGTPDSTGQAFTQNTLCLKQQFDPSITATFSNDNLLSST